MNKILITGGAGFIPSSLADSLLVDKENYVVAIDNFLTGSVDNIPNPRPKNYHFIKCDANDYNELSAIMLAYRFDIVFHYAAVVGVKRTLENPLLVLNDIEGIKHVLSLSKKQLVN